MVQHDANSHCAAQGKRAFLDETEHQGVPLFIESANATYYCVGPDEIRSMPSRFGADVIEGAELKGVGVVAVVPGSIADKAGVKPGDIVYEFASLSISRSEDLRTAIDGTAPGDSVAVKLRRNKRDVTSTAHF
jgi:C-terminal processing protease CtpA/Prc